MPDGSAAQRGGRPFRRNPPGGWDRHNNLNAGLIDECRRVDKATSALLTDLQRRGLLEDTLVLFGSEFGRLPTAQGPDGRDHNVKGY